MLKDHLTRYTKSVYPMHMPGHKGGRMRLVEDFYQVDVTEVPDTDHLYQAEGILAESMKGLSDFYHTKKSIYLVNGTTVGILSALGGLHQQGDQVLVARNCHHSVYSGLALFNLAPIYIYPEMTQWGLVGGILPEKVKEILAANPKVVSFIMTSPTYDGFISDIKSIREICHRYNVTLIVDEAHGAHLPYSDALPESAIDCGSDIVLHSVHKTLPAVTGASLMHLNLPKDQEEKVLKTLGRLQTSSPSYIMMANMDACVQVLAKDKKLWKNLLANIGSLDKSLKAMKYLKTVYNYKSKKEGIFATDPFKSIVLTIDSSQNGHELSNILRHKFGIQMEMADTYHVLGIFSPADAKKDIRRYGKALRKLDGHVSTGESLSSDKILGVHDALPEQVISLYDADHISCEWVPMDEAVGRVSGDMIIPYPPGIPLVVAGERITGESLIHLKKWLSWQVDVLGVRDDCVKVLILK